MGRLLASIALVFSLASCDVGTFPADGEGGGDVDAGQSGEVTFSGQVSGDMGLCAACHGAIPVDNETSLTTYNEVLAVVDTDTPANSLLLQHFDPATDPPLSADHAPYINDTRFMLYTEWIEAGAPE